MTEKQLQTQNTEENVVAGAVGAFLFSLVGGILWFLLYQVGFLAAVSGIFGVVCAIKGYAVFAKKESIKGIVISIVSAVVVLIIAWYLCLSLDVYNAYRGWYEAGEIDYTITFMDAVRNAYLFLSDGETAFAYLKDLGIGLLLCVFGAASSISNALKRVKAANLAEQEMVFEATAYEVTPQEENEEDLDELEI